MPPDHCLIAAPGSLRPYGRGSALGSHYRGSFDEVHGRYDRTVQTESCFRVRPRGFFPDPAFGREQSNSTGGIRTRVATSFTGARPKTEVRVFLEAAGPLWLLAGSLGCGGKQSPVCASDFGLRTSSLASPLTSRSPRGSRSANLLSPCGPSFIPAALTPSL